MPDYTALYRGSVFDANDPERRGRIRVLVPQVMGDSPSGWAEPTLGTKDIPNLQIQDKVWILFEGGDINRPTYIARPEVDMGDLSTGLYTELQTTSQNAADALAATEDLSDILDGVRQTFFQSTAPTGLSATNVGDLWLDTDTGEAYEWDGDSWELLGDQSISAALTAAQNAQTTADGKITSYYDPNPPGTGEVGDLWFETDNGNKQYYCSAPGPVWTALPTGLGALGTDVTARALGSITTTTSSSAPSSPITGDLWIDSGNGNVLKRWNGTTWTNAQDAAISAAASLADAKMRIFYENKDASVLRPASNPTMTASDIGDLWFRLDAGNKPYRWDGTVWAPFLFASTVTTSDGAAPTSSPTPTLISMLGAIQAKWSTVTNSDPVLYEVHISATSGFTPGAGTLVATTPQNNVVIKSLPDGSPLAYVPYFVKIIAKDADGAAAASSQTTGSPGQVTGPDISADAITANMVQSGTLQSTVAVTGRLEVGQGYWTPTALVLPQPDGEIRLPMDGSAATITADLNARTLNVNGALAVNGSGSLASGSVLSAATGVTAPGTVPSLGYTWPSQQTGLGSPTDKSNPGNSRRGILTNPSDSTEWVVLSTISGKTYMERWDKATGTLEATIVSGDVGAPSYQSWAAAFEAHGFTYLGGWYYIYGRNTSTGLFHIYQIHGTAFWFNAANSGSLWSTPPQRFGIGSDGVWLWVAYVASGVQYLERWDPANLVSGSGYASFNLGGTVLTDVAFVASSTFDLGSQTLLIAGANGAFAYNHPSPSSTPTRSAGNDFLLPAAPASITLDTGIFLTLDWYGRIWSHSPATTDQVWRVGQTWYDGNSTGGLHETVIGPSTTFTVPKRAHLSVSAGVPPNAGSAAADAANRVRVYAARGTTDPGASAIRRQAEITAAPWKTTLTTPSTSTTLASTVPNAGESTSAFPAAATPGEVKSASVVAGLSGWTYKGDGSAQLGRVVAASTGAMSGAGMDSWTVTISGGSNQTISGTTNTDISGLTQTITVGSSDEVYLVTFSGWCLPASGHTQITALVVDGTEQGAVIASIGNASGGVGTYSATWRVTGLTAGSRIFKFRGRMSAAGQTGGWAGSPNTWMTIERKA